MTDPQSTAAGRPGYTIAGGRAEADRLSRQATVMADATAAFLTRLGVRAAVARAVQDPDTTFFQARIHQVAGRRP